MSSAAWLISDRVVQRAHALLRRDPGLQAALSSPEDVAAIRAAGGSSIHYVAAACERYAHRVCFVTGSRELTYAAVWDRIRGLAAGMVQNGLATKAQMIGICGAPSTAWVIADLTCLYVGAVSVPLHVGMSLEHLRHAIRQAALETIFCGGPELPLIQQLAAECPSVRTVVIMSEGVAPDGTGGAAAAVAGLPRAHRYFHMDVLEREAGAVARCVPAAGSDPLVTINFSSGSTGVPKGVLLTERRWAAQLEFALTWPRIPHVHVGYLPHSHISGRRLVYEVMMNGGVTHFPATGDLSSLFDDIRAARPTILPLLPHLANLTSQHFQTECLRRSGSPQAIAAGDPIGERVMHEMRETFLGDRLCLIRTGTAPLAPEVQDFVARCFDVPVANGYGSTELGSIAVNGRILPHNEHKLVDAPELGYRVSDTPPRGELYVRSAEATVGYLNDPEATAALFDAEGFLRTGDVVEQPEPGFVVPLGRRKDVIRLAHGEFINVSELESVYGGRIPLIRQIVIHGSPLRSVLLAIVVPRLDAIAADDRDSAALVRRQLRREFERVARDQRLPSHEVPRDFIIEPEPFTRENGCLTDALKLDRPRVTALYQARLDALYANMEVRALAQQGTASGHTTSVEHRVRSAFSATLGIDEDELDAGWSELSFTGLGGDSLGAVRFCELVKEVTGVRPQVAMVLDPTASLSAIAVHVKDLLEEGPKAGSFEAVHGDAHEIVDARDLDIDRLLAGTGSAPAVRAGAPVTVPPRVVLLTGATGFLGRFLLLELLDRLPQDGHVVCLVRAPDDRAATERLRACFRAKRAVPGSDRRSERIDQCLREGRVVVHASDLMRPNLGLAPTTYARLAREVDAVLHNGALVNHALSYRSLFGPNVAGTVQIIRFALERAGMAIHFVSSIGIVDRGRATAPVREDQSAEMLWPTRSVGSRADEYAVGYITSKWACEILLTQVHERHGVPVRILRCGVLLPHRRIPGEVNDRDGFNRLLFGIISTGLAPLSFYAPAPGVAPYFGGIPVDLAASAIAAVALSGTTGTATYHLDEAVRSGISMDSFIDAIEAAGVALERLPYAEWYTRFTKALAGLPEPASARSLLQIMGRWEMPVEPAARRHFDNTRFRDQVGERAGAIEMAPLTSSFIADWIQSLRARP